MRKKTPIILILLVITSIFAPLIPTIIWTTEKVETRIMISEPPLNRTKLERTRGTIIVDDDGGQDYQTISDAINNAGMGDTIFIWAGTYEERLWVTKSLTLVGNGSDDSIIISSRHSDVIQLKADNVNVRDLKVIQTAGGGTGGSAISVNGNDCCIENVNITDGGYGIDIQNYHNCEISNTSIYSSSRCGIQIENSNNNIITNNTCIDSRSDYGISIRSSIKNVLKNNKLIDDGYFIWGDTEEQWKTHSIDTSNTVNGRPLSYQKDIIGGRVPAGAGQIILANCTNVTIDRQHISGGDISIIIGFSKGTIINDNTCEGGEEGGVLLAYSDNNRITNNNCTSNRYGIYLYLSKNNTVKNNICSYNEGTGINLYMGRNNSVVDNILDSNIYAIIVDETDNNTVTANNAQFNRGGLYIGGKFNAVIGNNATNNEYGLRLGGDNNNIRNNCLTNNEYYGIDIKNADGNVLVNNTCDNNQNLGIWVYKSDNNTLINSSVSNNGQGILMSESYENLMYGIDCNFNSEKGLFFEEYGTGNLISNCNFNDNEYGIYHYSGSGNSFLNNTCDSNDEDGIWIRTGLCNIVNNTCSSNQRNGILITGYENIVTDNTCNSNNDHGIYLDMSDKNIISNNTCDSNMENGMYIYASRYNSISNNTCRENGECGVKMEAQYSWNTYENTIIYNTFSLNSNYGLSFDEYCNNNDIHHNGFINNNGITSQAFDDGLSNKWNSAHQRGNYWSDYSSRNPNAGNNRRIWDTPYGIDGTAGSRDNYPLCAPPSDSTPPALKDDRTPSNPTTGDQFTFTADIIDNYKVISADVIYSFDDGNCENLSMNDISLERWVASLIVPNDAETLHYRYYAEDAAGNYLLTQLISCHVLDDEKPVLSMENAPETATTGDNYTISAVIRDNVGIFEATINYTYDNNDYLTTPMLFTDDDIWRGTINLDATITRFDYYIYYTDKGGNSCYTDTRTVVVHDNDIPSLFLEQTLAKPSTGDDCTFSVLLTDNVGIEFAFLNYTFNDSLVSYQVPMSNSDGRWYVTIEMPSNILFIEYNYYYMDYSGNHNASSRIIIYVTDNDDPVPQAGDDIRIKPGINITFDASGSNDNVGITNYTWSFIYNDNEILLYGSLIYFYFEKVGNYVIVLTVADGAGNMASDSFNITVISMEPIDDDDDDIKDDTDDDVENDETDDDVEDDDIDDDDIDNTRDEDTGKEVQKRGSRITTILIIAMTLLIILVILLYLIFFRKQKNQDINHEMTGNITHESFGITTPAVHSQLSPEMIQQRDGINQSNNHVKENEETAIATKPSQGPYPGPLPIVSSRSIPSDETGNIDT